MSELRPEGKVRIWIWPTPKDGEMVPDYPPMDLSEHVTNVQVEGDLRRPTNPPEDARIYLTDRDVTLRREGETWVEDDPS